MNDQKSNARQHLPAGILAIAQHIVTWELPAPASIDTNTNPDDLAGAITVWVSDSALAAYIDTVQVNDEAAELKRPSGSGQRYKVQRFWCQLPASGIRFTIRTSSLDRHEDHR